jgi:hypothetical protein
MFAFKSAHSTQPLARARGACGEACMGYKVYLCQYGDTDCYALSRDETGANLPKNGHHWVARSDMTSDQLEKSHLGYLLDDLVEQGWCKVEASFNEETS